MTALIIASDIFGRTPAFDALADVLANHADRTIRVDPYAGERIDFADEAAAYACFERQVGLERYSLTLLQAATGIGGDRVLIGFSVGASAVWAASEKLNPTGRRMGIGFYGAQIRHLTAIQPAFPIELFFPEHEPHFDVDRLVVALRLKKKVTCQTVPYAHGFMNRRSVNFHEQAYHEHVDLLEGRIKRFQQQRPGTSGERGQT